MIIKNKLKKSDRFRSYTNYFKTPTETGQEPVIYEKKRKSTLCLRIPILVDVQRYMTENHDIIVDLMLPGMPERDFKIFSLAPRANNFRVINKLSQLDDEKKLIKKSFESLIKEKNTNLQSIALDKPAGNSDLGGDMNGIVNKRNNQSDLSVSGVANSLNPPKRDSLSKNQSEKIRSMTVNAMARYERDRSHKVLNNSFLVSKSYRLNVSSVIKKDEIQKSNEFSNRQRKSYKRRGLRYKNISKTIFGTKKVGKLHAITSPPQIAKSLKSQKIINVLPNKPELSEKKGRDSTDTIINKKKSTTHLINEIYNKNSDPAESFVGLNTHLSEKQKRKNVVPQMKVNGGMFSNGKSSVVDSIKFNKNKRKSPDISLRNALFESPLIHEKSRLGYGDSIKVQSDNEKTNFLHKVRFVEQTNTERYVFLDIPMEDIKGSANGSSVSLRFRLVNKRGINIAVKREDIDIRPVQRNFAIDNIAYPYVSVRESTQRNKKTKVSIENSSPVKTNFKVFRKVLSSNNIDINNRFQMIMEGSIPSKKKKIKTPDRSTGRSKSIYRVTFSADSYENFNNFSTFQPKNIKGEFSENSRIKIYAGKGENPRYPDISISNMSGKFREVKLLKRKSGKKGTKFKEVKEKFKENITGIRSGTDNVNRILPKNLDTSIGSRVTGITDTSSKSDENVEYKIQVVTKKGEKIDVDHTFRTNYKRPKKVFNTSIDFKEANLKNSSVKFGINLKKSNTGLTQQVNKFVNSLDEKERETFKSEIESIKDSLSTKSTVKYSMQNLNTGKTFDIGEFNEGEEVNFKQNFEPGSYKIIANPTEISIASNISEIDRKIKNMGSLVASNVNINSQQVIQKL